MQTVMNTWRFKCQCFLFVQQSVISVFSDRQSRQNFPSLPAFDGSCNSSAAINKTIIDHSLGVVTVHDDTEASVDCLNYIMRLSLDGGTLYMIGEE
jgi:hypothetical protein